MKSHHIKACGSIALMCIWDFSSYSICNKPVIYSYCYGTENNRYWRFQLNMMGQTSNITTNTTSESPEGISGNLQIRHMWQWDIDTIIDDRVMSTDTKLHFYRHLDNVLDSLDRYKIINISSHAWHRTNTLLPLFSPLMKWSGGKLNGFSNKYICN